MSNVKVTTVAKSNLQLRELLNPSVGTETNARQTIVVFFAWLGASSKALDKYFELYHSLGYNILHVPGTVMHFAWPPRSVSLATEVLEYICTYMTGYRYILVHSSSIGSYNYTSCLMEINKNPQKYWNFSLRLVGNVFDSITYGSYDRMRVGVSYGFTKNNLLRILMQQFFAFYFIITKSKTVDFYEIGVNAFRDYPAEVPSIFFYSTDDPLCDHALIDKMVEIWHQRDIPVLSKCWETSVHAGHFFKHKKEYLLNHQKFMEIVNDYCAKKEEKLKQFRTKSNL